MTFDDALVKKAKLPKSIPYKGLKLKIYLAPLASEDLERFIAHLEGHRINDQTARSFSHNEQFTVKAIAVNDEAVTCLSYNEVISLLRK